MNQIPAGAYEGDLDLILFQIGGVRYGADAGLVASATALQGAEPEGLHWFHEAMGYPAGRVPYRNPVVLALHSDSTRIVVDRLEGILRVPLSDLRPFPPLIESAVGTRGLWAVAKRDPNLLLLVDLHRLAMATRTPTCNPGDPSS